MTTVTKPAAVPTHNCPISRKFRGLAGRAEEMLKMTTTGDGWLVVDLELKESVSAPPVRLLQLCLQNMGRTLPSIS